MSSTTLQKYIGPYRFYLKMAICWQMVNVELRPARALFGDYEYNLEMLKRTLIVAMPMVR